MEERFYEIYNSDEVLESKKLGEVYTPEFIAREMVERIPEEIWNNKNIKVLDFACGTGIFAFFIYKKLIKHFSHEYVVDNILYFNDIQEKNIKKINYVFNNPRNIHCGDFLQWNCDQHFDVIIGNPPFQAHDNKKSNGNSIWHKFVDKLLLLLNDGGYLSLIHPSGWRKPSTEKCKYTYLYTELTQKRQMIYLEMHTNRDGVKNFNSNVIYDVYLVKNVLPYDTTEIIDHASNIVNIDLRKFAFIPNKNLEFIYNLLDCTGDDIKILYSSSFYDIRRKHVSKTHDDVYKYPLIHSVRKNGINFRYTSLFDDRYFGVSKIVISPQPYNVCNFYVDLDGKYGFTSAAFAIIIKDVENAYKISYALKNKNFLEFKQAFTFHNNALDFRCFYYFKDGIWDKF